MVGVAVVVAVNEGVEVRLGVAVIVAVRVNAKVGVGAKFGVPAATGTSDSRTEMNGIPVAMNVAILGITIATLVLSGSTKSKVGLGVTAGRG
jgi:hypothetical protein